MRKRSRATFLIMGVTFIVLVSMVWSMSSILATGETTDIAAILVNHTMVDPAQIPQIWLDAAREQDTFFAHRSVGNNILEGLADWQSQNPGRYTIDMALAEPEWFIANGGILHQLLGTNTEPQTKIDGFNMFIRGGYHTADAAMMKFCPSDVIPFGTMPAVNIWLRYRDMMAALEQDYPHTLFVWWTMPLSTASDDRGNDEKEIFNELMRSYCDTDGCVLFDIADIESHDPDDNSVVSPAGYEAMWDGYSDDGGHLNMTGRLRVAAAYWWLLARTAGWDPDLPTEPGFALGITPETADVVWGGTAVYTISAQSIGGFSQPIQVDVTGLPSEAVIAWGMNPLPPDQTTTLTIGVNETVAAGDYLFYVTGMADSITEMAAANLGVRRPLFLPLVMR
jgi:hypothetical protein